MPARRSRWSLAPLTAAALLAGCALRPSRIADSEHLVMIKSVRLPVRDWLPWYTRFAEHVWVDFKRDDVWHRIEWDDIQYVRTYQLEPDDAFADQRWERAVAVHDVFDGAEGQRFATGIHAAAKRFPCTKKYRAWPGPNSNTFVEWLALELGMPIKLPATAVGKDFVTWFYAGVTTSGTGLECETLPLGLEVGVREGIEVHLLGIGFGVGIWPPAIKLPFLPAIPGGWLGP